MVGQAERENWPTWAEPAPPPLSVRVYKTVGHVHTLTHTLEELNGPLFGINAKVS